MVPWTKSIDFLATQNPPKNPLIQKIPPPKKNKQHIPKNVPRTGKVIIAWQASIRCNHRNATHPFWMTVEARTFLSMDLGEIFNQPWCSTKKPLNMYNARYLHITVNEKAVMDVLTCKCSLKNQSFENHMYKWHEMIKWQQKKRCIPRIHRVTMTTGYHCFQLLSLEVPFCFTKINDIWWVYQMIPQGGAP